MKQGMQLWRIGGRWGLMAALVLAANTVAWGSEGPSRKLVKQISMFEQATNRMLVDSTNFLVSGMNSSGGLYLPGYGVVVTFSASLTDRNFQFDFSDWLDNFHIEHNDDGSWVVHIEDWNDEARDRVKHDLKKAAEKAQKAAEELRAEREQRRAEMEDRRAELYGEGKEEMIELILDYGETLLRLRDNERVMVAAFLDNHEYSRDKRNHRDQRVTKLIVSAGMADLRAYAEGDIDEDTMRSRLDIVEY